jgi:hypothetical protein
MASPLHKKIGDVLKNMEKVLGMDVILDKECGIGKINKKQQIPLFIKKPKGNGTEICNVDAMIIKDNKIRIIIEIEESDNKPTQICGKYLTSNLAEFYAHDTLGKGKEINIDKSSVLFIQIIDTKSLKKGSNKPIQFDHIEIAINNLIYTAETAKIDHGCIKNYKLIKIDGNNLSQDILFDEFKNIIKNEI